MSEGRVREKAAVMFASRLMTDSGFGRDRTRLTGALFFFGNGYGLLVTE